MRNLVRFMLTLLAAIVAAACAYAQPEWQFEGAGRVVAVADIHGAYDAFERILRRAGIIDDAGDWSGGESHLVIVGDVLDRGPDSRRALDLIMRLENEAPSDGGRVHMVLGNHEVMNMTGDLRYVAPAEYAAFAADESVAMRDAAFVANVRALTERGQRPPSRLEFEALYPAGFFAHRQAFSPQGVYGAWLLEQPLFAVIDGVAFVHGGLADAVIEFGSDMPARLSRDFEQYVAGLATLIDAGLLAATDSVYDHPAILAAAIERGSLEASEDAVSALRQTASRLVEVQAGALFAADGPIWYRGNVGCNRLSEFDRLSAALAQVGATRLVIGHTPTQGAVILSRWDESLLRVDTGMLNDYYGGRASALIIEDGAFSAVYEDDEQVRAPLPQPRRVGIRPQALSEDELETILARGEIEVLGVFDSTASVVRVVDGELELLAIFTRSGRAEFRPATAAYRLDRLLGLDMVPVTVARNDADGVPGSLQFLPSSSLNEAERRAEGAGSSAWCPLADQFRDMAVFDLLIYNEARTAERIRYSSDNLEMLLVGHDRVMEPERGRPDYLAGAAVELTPEWRAALESLDEAGLGSALGDVLDRRRIRALLARRDALLESAQ